ncbi:hypothetical protein BDN72DRAFT_825950 [Pluteus cervinus]|uniref:Uncharacterized protein n=1 Tax=Pluteus cervinus TaxID=181527 RepID=A0ACD3AEW3_9AGAR|nr:hypothetical protein BDN72DRAFT_825950 [Pluteus cervinus]
MSSLQPSLRPWLAAAARSSGKCFKRTSNRYAARQLSTLPQPERLETPKDWTQFQMNRAEIITLKNIFSQHGSTQTKENTFQPSHGLHRPQSRATASALLAAGAHFGHSSTRMNPNFTPYAYGTRAGITVIDLDQTLPLLRRAANLVRAVAYANGQIVFIGTRPDLRPIVEKAAERVGKQGYHVGERWLPGTLTNKVQMYGNAVVKEEKVTPDLVILLNPLANMNAIRECAIEHVPTIGIIDSNADPRIVMYPIPANDENTRTAELIAGVLSIAGREGTALRQAEDERRAEKQARQAPFPHRR